VSMRRVFRRFRPALAAALLIALYGCATVRPAPAPAAELWKEYERAVEEARYPRPERVSRDLVPLATWFDGLVWDASGERVLMVTWTRAAYYDPPPAALGATVWLTAAPFLQRFCQTSGLAGEALAARLRQRLGLPPDSAKDAFVEMWVSPADLFRPCPDPEVDDRECQVSLGTAPPGHGAPCPWGAEPAQVSAKFVAVTKEHAAWMCDNWTASYPPGEPRKSYPWTALGYTYDWSPSSPRHVGDSEFVAPKGTPVAVRAVVPTDRYCAPPVPRR
jgi:hypothetical protein